MLLLLLYFFIYLFISFSTQKDISDFDCASRDMDCFTDSSLLFQDKNLWAWT